MKLIICGDTHIGAVLGLGRPNGLGGNTRVDDYKSTLNHIVDYAIDEGADAFIITGDVFHSREPDIQDIVVINNAIKKASDAGITTILLMGNHDYQRTGDSYTSSISNLSASDFVNTRVVLTPQIIEISNNRGEAANLLILPYRDRRMFPGKSTEEDSALYEDMVKDIIANRESDAPIVAVGHNFFLQGSYKEFGGSEVLIRPSAFSDCDMVIMGHYHNFKIIKKKDPIAFYVGSMEKLNFGDINTDKFFIEYTVETKRVAVKKLKVREIVDELISLADIDLNEAENIKPILLKRLDKVDVKDKIVRIKVAVKDTLASMIKKRFLEKALYERGAFYVSSVGLDILYNRAIKNVDILDNKNDFDIFAAYTKKQDLTDAIKDKILKEAREIIED